MLFFVAIATGAGWNIDKIAEEMPLGMLREWAAFRKLHPLAMSPHYAQRRQDWNAAMIASSVWNITAAAHFKRPRKREVPDFMFRDTTIPTVEKSPGELFLLLKTSVGADKIMPTV